MDDRFVVETEDGFVYWSGDFATRVTADIGVFRASQSVYKVSAETDLVRGRGHIKELAAALENEMDECSFSGPVYDQQSDTFRMYCGVYATSDHAHWLRRTFNAAISLQMSETSEMARRLSARFHVSPATSAHPHAGLRTAPDPVLSLAYSLFHPSGDQPSAWEGVPAWEQAGWILERESRRFDGDRQTYLTAEFDWACGEGGMMLSIRTDEPHAKLGNGLHITLTVPLRLSADAIGHLVLDLNTYEKTEYKRCHTLGSWCAHQGQLAFREFVPNSLFDPEYLEEVCVNMCTRAIWTNEWFYEMKCKAQAAKA